MSVIAVVVVGIMGGDVKGKQVGVNAVVVVVVPACFLGFKTILPYSSCSNLV